MIDLTGRRVLVTGGSRGIGAACCRLFARAGATVLIQYLASGERARALYAELLRTSGRPHLKARCDVSDPEQIEKLFEQVRQEWGGLDCLVTASMGLIELPRYKMDEVGFQRLYSIADRLLYEAKEGGRNRTVAEKITLFEGAPRKRPPIPLAI